MIRLLKSRGAAIGIVLLAIALLGCVLMFHRLGAAGVCSYNEAVEGLFLQQMVEHGGGLFPIAAREGPLYKPPLFHWTALSLDRLFGVRKVTALNLRVPAALYGLAGLLLIVYFTYTIYGAEAALLAGLVLLGSWQYVSQARFGRVDMTLTFCEALALTSFVLWWRGFHAQEGASGQVWRWVFALALGSGVLAKGPVGALLPLIAVGIFIALNGDWNAAARLFSPGSALLAVAVGASWYAACLIGGRFDFLARQLGSENLGRFFGALGAMPPWYYVVPLLFNSGPLSLIAPAAAGAALIAAARRPAGGRDGAIGAAQLMALFWIVTVVFFTLAAYKRRTYLLPLWPANAVLIAWWIESRGHYRRALRAGFAALCAVLIAINLIAIPRREANSCGKGSFEAAAAQINRIVGADEPLFVYRMDDPAALIFYLDRGVSFIGGELGDAPPGYIIIRAAVWEQDRRRAPGLEPIAGPTPGEDPLILLRHGKVYAGHGHAHWNISYVIATVITVDFPAALFDHQARRS